MAEDRTVLTDVKLVIDPLGPHLFFILKHTTYRFFSFCLKKSSLCAGQFVSLESLKASGAGCPRELTPIKIPKCDAQYDPKCTGTKKTPFLRAKYDPKTGHSPGMPREQVMQRMPRKTRLLLLRCRTLPFGPNDQIYIVYDL